MGGFSLLQGTELRPYSIHVKLCSMDSDGLAVQNNVSVNGEKFWMAAMNSPSLKAANSPGPSGERRLSGSPRISKGSQDSAGRKSSPPPLQLNLPGGAEGPSTLEL